MRPEHAAGRGDVFEAGEDGGGWGEAHGEVGEGGEEEGATCDGETRSEEKTVSVFTLSLPETSRALAKKYEE